MFVQLERGVTGARSVELGVPRCPAVGLVLLMLVHCGAMAPSPVWVLRHVPLWLLLLGAPALLGVCSRGLCHVLFLTWPGRVMCVCIRLCYRFTIALTRALNTTLAPFCSRLRSLETALPLKLAL